MMPDTFWMLKNKLVVTTFTALLAVSGAGMAQQSAKTGLPDWKGVWAPGGGGGAGAPGAAGPGAGASGGPPAGAAAGPSVAGAGNNAAAGRQNNPVVFTPAYQPLQDAILRGERGNRFDPRECIAPGMPELLTMPYPFEFIIEPERVTIAYEYYSQVRRIYTDGRKFPPDEELDPTFNGYSIGHWEGDTLVVETRGVTERTYVNRNAIHSDAMQITERYRRINPATMQVEVTVTDPKAFAKPWNASYRWTLRKDWEIKEYVCENNRDTFGGVTGVQGTPTSTPTGK